MLIVSVDSGAWASPRPPGDHQPGGERAGRGIRCVSLSSGPDLADRLVGELADELARSDGRCLIVGDMTSAATAARMARFARQLFRTHRIASVVVECSPFRLAVLLRHVQGLEERELVQQDSAHLALRTLLERSAGLMVSTSVRRLTRPRPTWLQRLGIRTPGTLFMALDHTAGDEETSPAVWTVSLQSGVPEPLLAPVLSRVGSAPDIAVSRGSAKLELGPLFRILQPRQVEEVATQPEWSRRWGGRQAWEIVVTPADLLPVAEAIRVARAASWPCSWCGEWMDVLATCATCGAEFRHGHSLRSPAVA